MAKPKTFEEKLAELEKIVTDLEEGQGDLEDSLKAFEAGIKLSRICHQDLSKAEKRVEVLLKSGEEIIGSEELD